MSECEKYKPYIVGLIDKELTPQEAYDTQNHLTRCESCRQEFEDLCKSNNILDSISFKEPEDITIEKIWRNPFSRFARVMSIFMIIAGWLCVTSYGMYEFFTDGSEALIVKIGSATLIIGFIVLLIQLIQQRMKMYKTDPYKEVIR